MLNKMTINKKNKMGSNGMEPAMLTPRYNMFNYTTYLNVSKKYFYGYADMAEWLTQLVNTKRPLGLVGSISTISVTYFKFGELLI